MGDYKKNPKKPYVRMSKDKKDDRFDIVYSVQATYTLTPNDLKFLNVGQPIQVIVDEHCGMILHPPKENKDEL